MNHPLAQVDLYHSVDSYMDIPWAMGNVTKPSVAAGCLIKLLNYNPISHAMTFLYCMKMPLHIGIFVKSMISLILN